MQERVELVGGELAIRSGAAWHQCARACPFPRRVVDRSCFACSWPTITPSCAPECALCSKTFRVEVVAEAGDGHEALQLCVQRRPIAALVDILDADFERLKPRRG